ncbi:S8 family serine peptidase [Actinokineospora auranticolor]|uniref:Subtilase family protein n=1 Tax=Actinokineospora auranticolor TaxID=155976 RepID=A0A2S6GT17_9PSEU|nr:S8 family serine peptidase [Actinokineospora auranticolor]PPK68395.1 subtilase family protein [Actinokineospora auranticolor]
MRLSSMAAVSAAALVLSATAVPVAVARSGPPPAGAARGAPTTVTLITGDQVRLVGGRAVLAGLRPGVSYRTYTAAHRVRVFPSDAVPLLRSGQLDQGLFDVTGLAEAGYGERADLPLIQTGPATNVAGVRTIRDLPSIGGRAITVEKASLPAVWRQLAATGGKVWLDSKIRPAPEIDPVPAVPRGGLTGAGVQVAVVDTGIDGIGHEVAEKDFTDGVAHGSDHGTRVAATIAGAVAPGIDLLDAKALGADGTGQLSWIIAAAEWAADQGADIVDVGAGLGDADNGLLRQSLDRLSATKNTLFVAGAEPVSRDHAPAATAALTVDPAHRPAAVGAAALLAQRHPDWRGAPLKRRLMSTMDSSSPDPAQALADVVTTDPAFIELPSQPWPHTDDTPVRVPLTYRNSGPTPVTLDLVVRETTLGLPLPPGMATVSPTRITIPAGGSTQVTYTADTSVGTEDGYFYGNIIGTGDGQTVYTSIRLVRDFEEYDVTVHYFDGDGKPSQDWFIATMDLKSAGNIWLFYPDPDGVWRRRLRRGQYVLDNSLSRQDDVRYLPITSLAVTKPLDLVVDARTAEPIQLDLPRLPEPLFAVNLGVVLDTEDGREAALDVMVGDPNTLRSAQVGPNAPPGVLTSVIGALYGDPFDMDTVRSHYLAAWPYLDGVPTGATHSLTAADFAAVRLRFVNLPTKRYWLFEGLEPVARGGRDIPLLRGALADEDVVDYVAGPDVRWEAVSVLYGSSPDAPDLEFIGEPRRYHPGGTYEHRFNHAVLGPALPRSYHPWAERVGDRLRMNMSLWGNDDTSITLNSRTLRTALYRDGVEIRPSREPSNVESYQVPADAGTYRYTMEGTRRPGPVLSTTVSAEWTFCSRPGHRIVPLSVVRFAPTLADDNTAPPGHFTVPFFLQLEDGTHTTPHNLATDVSYDEGKTWQPAEIHHNTLRLDQPDTATSVSLRAHAEDGRGGTIDQTIIHAYTIKKP